MALAIFKAFWQVFFNDSEEKSLVAANPQAPLNRTRTPKPKLWEDSTASTTPSLVDKLSVERVTMRTSP
ncbi:MAG: hypothetical protein ACD_37C00181G0001 [uncultured bacterium]|nr:MAG: hypothetical protein ACD_37C00181G0001 [uncultured bacterium]